MRDHGRGGALTEVTFYILLALYTPRHGYAVMQFIEEKTGGRLVLGAGTLYGALNTLAEKGWIAPCGNEDASPWSNGNNAPRGNGGTASRKSGGNAHWKSRDGRKKEYMVTALGREMAAKEYTRLQELTEVAAEIMDIR